MQIRRLLIAMAALVPLVTLNVGRASATEVGIQRPVGVGLVAGSSPGLTAKIWTRPRDLQLAGRVPLGLDLYVFNWLEAYGELTPSLAFGPSVFFLEGALGARIYL